MPPLLTNIIGSAADSLFNTIAGWFGADTSARKQFEYTNKLMDRQEAWSEKMYHAQNDYNTPSNQLQRAQDAGINPNSFLASNPTSAAQPSQVPTTPFGAPNYPTQSLQNVIPNILTLSQAKGQDISNSWTPRQFSAALANTLADTSVKNSIKGLNDAQREQTYAAINIAKTHNEAELKLIYQQVDEVAQRIIESKQRVKQSEQAIEESKQSIAESKSRVTGLEFDNDVKSVKSQLAKAGVIVDGGEIGALLSLLLSEEGRKAIDSIYQKLLKDLNDLKDGFLSGMSKFNPKNWF